MADLSESVKELTEEELLDLEIERESAEREAENAPLVQADALARKRIEVADIKAVRKAEKEHGPLEVGNIGTAKTRFGVVIVKAPARADYRKLTETKDPTNATLEEYCSKCLVHPTPAEFATWAKAQPGILSGIAAVCSKLAGYKEDALAKK